MTEENNTPWLIVGLALIVTLFTPLGRIWPIVLMLAGAAVMAGQLKARPAILIALAALIGGVFHSGSWKNFAPSFELDQTANENIVSPENGNLIPLDFSGIRRVEVHGFNGNIRVNVDRQQVLIVQRKGQVNLPITERRNDTLFIQAKRPFIWSDSGINFELHLPANLVLHLETNNGNIETNGSTPELFASTSNGNITTTNVGRTKMQLQNQNGQILAQHFAGQLIATTSNDRLLVRDASQSNLELNDSNAEIVLERIQLAANSHSSANTSNDQIRATGIHAPAGLVLRGQSSEKADVRLAGAALKISDGKFEARREGFGPAEFNLVTQNAGIVVR